MHRTLLPLTLAVFALAACEAPTTGPRAPLRDPSRAVVENAHDDVMVLGFNGCNGEFLTGSGKLHTVLGITPDAAGGFHVTYKQQFSDVKLTGTSGASYVASQQTSENFTFGGAETLTIDQSEKLIGQGRTPNSVLHFLLHLTVNANGEVSSFVDRFSIDCH